MKKSIYPIISTSKQREGYCMETWMRIERDGKYYLQMMRRTTSKKPNHEITKQFIIECYRNLVLAIPVPGLTTIDGEAVFVLDPNQESEAERMKKTLI